MKTILLSFTPDWFLELEKGNMKIEYRKNFPSDDVIAYFYVSSPIKAISGIAHFSQRESLKSWLDKYASRSQEVKDRILEYMEDCRYAIPIKSFQATNYISLDTLKKDVPGFVVPRMYYYIDDTPLLEYLESNLTASKELFVHSFNETDDEICSL